MTRFITTLFLSTVLVIVVKGQKSLNEKTALWTTSSNWNSGTMPGTLSAGTITLDAKTIDIHGTVKLLDNITAHVSNISVSPGDTLIIFGNLTLSSGTSFANHGLLIVWGNVSNTNSNMFVGGSGKMVVTGYYSNTSGINTFIGPTYIFGSSPAMPGTGDVRDLRTKDRDLYNYQQSMLAALPIELAYFQATPENNQVQLKWETISEINNDYFLVERSPDGIHYDVVQRVAGAGNSKNTLEYIIFDRHPLRGRSYYKLIQVDFDGQKSEFKTVSVFHDSDVSLQVYPNPTTDFLYFSCSVCNYSVTLRDANGRLQLEGISVTELEQGKFGIDLTRLDAGVYFIVVTESDRTAPSTFRIVKK